MATKTDIMNKTAQHKHIQILMKPNHSLLQAICMNILERTCQLRLASYTHLVTSAYDLHLTNPFILKPSTANSSSQDSSYLVGIYVK